MPAASFLQTSFLGGEWSLAAQGRVDLKEYATAMSLCYNGVLLETGAWTRRPGTRFLATTYLGQPGRVIAFDFKQSTPYTMEFTPGALRFFNATDIVTTNDDKTVVSISSADPALVTVDAVMDWTTGDQVFFTGLGESMPLLQNRHFAWTYVSTTSGTLTDANTGVTIDGSTLGTLPSNTTISHISRLVTPFNISDIQSLRSVQAEKRSILLTPTNLPQVLTATLATPYAEFDVVEANLIDGPYLDPFTNGALVTPSAKTGIINLTVSFAAWVATTVYGKGTFITYSANSYRSLVDQNLNFQPDISSTKWEAVSPATAVSADGFQGSDIGRHIRLYSEPPLWVAGASYTAVTSIVKYNNFYWTCLANNTASVSNAPGGTGTSSLADWSLNPTGAVWTWGKITGLLNVISGSLSGSTNFGNMTSGGNVGAAFDGILSKPAATSAELTITSSGSSVSNWYVGKNYTGASAQAIGSATVFPSSNHGMASQAAYVFFAPVITCTLNLRAKQTSPLNSADGTLLGTFSQVFPATAAALLFGPAPITLTSNDTATTWNYVWVEMVVNIVNGGSNVVLGSFAQVQFYNPTGSASTTAGVSMEILGGDLLYTNPITTWRLGVYSGTTGYPACGTYHEGRLWLSGSVDNRLDASVVGQILKFAPTELDIGTVTDANAISYTLDGPDVNAIYWMKPDLQGIVVGTQAGEWLVQATTLNSPLTPFSMQAHRVTGIGCANIEPRRTEHTIVFVQVFKQKIMEYFADIFSGKFSAPNLASLARHLTSRMVLEIAYQKEPAATVWARCNDGSVLGFAYKRDTLMSSQGPTYVGWHQHVWGSGHSTASITDGPSTDGLLDTLALTSVGAANLYHVESLTTPFMETDDIVNAWFLDDGVRPSSATLTTSSGSPALKLNGLWHLNGQTATVFAGGLDCGDWPVTDGSCTVVFGQDPAGEFTPGFYASFDGNCPIVVGYVYKSRGQLVRPIGQKDTGAVNGPALGKKRRLHMFSALMVQSVGVKFGTAFDTLRRAIFKTAGGTPLPTTTPFSGVHWDTLDDTHSFDGMICWEIERPYPCTIAAIEGFIKTEDR